MGWQTTVWVVARCHPDAAQKRAQEYLASMPPLPERGYDDLELRLVRPLVADVVSGKALFHDSLLLWGGDFKSVVRDIFLENAAPFFKALWESRRVEGHDPEEPIFGFEHVIVFFEEEQCAGRDVWELHSDGTVLHRQGRDYDDDTYHNEPFWLGEN